MREVGRVGVFEDKVGGGMSAVLAKSGFVKPFLPSIQSVRIHYTPLN